MNRRCLSLFVPSALLSACAGNGKPPPDPPSVPELLQGVRERAGQVLAKDAYGDGATRLVYLDQNWGPPETVWYYHADQGSVLMPYDTLLHLEQAGSVEPFLRPEHMARFRFLNQHKTPNNPDALPIGLARHGDQVGLTCAACHTAQINYRGTAMRVDGAPTLLDMDGFLRAVQAALAATLADDAKLARFAAAVPGSGDAGARREAAKQSLAATLGWFESYNAANHSTVAEGFGRTDAVGRIFNQVIRFTSGAENSLQPNAPTSFPFLWDAPRHDYVQWTGFSSNADAGSVGRNAGEVIGAFGRVEVKHYETEEAAKQGYRSSIAAGEMVAMEEALRRLESPQWPEAILPPIDRKLAARGAALYQAHCQSCHAAIDRDDPRRKVVAMITGTEVVGTDDRSARNIVEARVPTGVLQGAISPKGDRYGAEASPLALLVDLVGRSLAQQPAAALAAVANAKLHGIGKTAKQGDHAQSTEASPLADVMAYKARPLNGIWATAPFLHNGSVPTLYDLLLPPAERPATFAVGRMEYEPRKVGYVSDGGVPFVLDTRVPGNSNRGHEYGTQLADGDRWALVEYLKTL
ncbi:MAG TPA: cytochrome c [Kofleriaceae bacterium]|nr:cytochrome c [Kofleriaceae bacterium]